jgi:hypothetical protein
MARVLLLVVMTGWLVVLLRAIHIRRRSQPDLRLLAALEALRHIKPT